HIPGCAGTRKNTGRVRAALAGTPHSPRPPRAPMHMVTLSLLYCLAANPATAPRALLCLHPRTPRPLASVHHQWMAPTLVGARGRQGGGQGLPPPVPAVVGNGFATRPWPAPRDARSTACETARELSHWAAKSSLARQMPRWSHRGANTLHQHSPWLSQEP